MIQIANSIRLHIDTQTRFKCYEIESALFNKVSNLIWRLNIDYIQPK